jgi:hypothetical protein
MSKIKKMLRLLCLALLIILAMTGVGIFGALFRTNNRYENKPIHSEVKDKREENDEDSDQ